MALRLSNLGTWALTNDEAWVALATRVEGLRQYWLAIAMTPIAWAGLVKLVAVVFGGSELALRAVPLAFGCLTMRMALGAGTRLAGHRLGGLVALAAVAFDPLEIMYAKILKQYTAEAFFCVLAIDRAAAFAARRDRRGLVVLALVLMLGLGFSNAQLFVAPAVLAALALDAILRRDVPTVRAVLVTTLVVGAWDLAYYAVLVAPRLPSELDPYWSAQMYVPSQPADAARVVWERLGWALRPALGRSGHAVAMVALGLACAVPRLRVAASALLLLVIELALLSNLRYVAIGQPRILIFLTSALAAFGAAAIAAVAVRARPRPLVAAVATLGAALLVYDFVAVHPWRNLGRIFAIEDAGPLVRLLARERQPAETVLVHPTAMLIFAYYHPATPLLDPVAGISVGYVPRPPDPRVVIVNDQNLVERATAALRASPRVWFLASRLHPTRERRIREQLARVAPAAEDHRRPGAFLLRMAPRTLVVPPP